MRPYEFAKKHGVENQTVYRWIREGKIKAKRIKVVVERFEIDDSQTAPQKR